MSGENPVCLNENTSKHLIEETPKTPERKDTLLSLIPPLTLLDDEGNEDNYNPGIDSEWD